VTATIPVDSDPVGVTFTPDGAYVYVTSSNTPGSVSVISTATNTVTATLRGIAPAGPLTMDVGQTQLFTATPWDGSGAIHYQWYVNDVAVGTDNSSYSYTASGSYASVTCKVNDSASPPRTSPASNAISVTVDPALTATVTPSSVTMDVSQTQQFTCAASGGTGTLHYQWYITGSTVSGETSTSYMFSASAAGSPTIYCRVTDEASSPLAVQSNTPSVTVNSALAAPTVTPTSAMVDQGQTSILTSTTVTTGTSPYTHKWFVKAPVGSYSLIGGATSTSYSFVTSTLTATGTWSFILQLTDNTGATVNSTAVTVAVAALPTVSIAPAGPLTMDVGQTQLFTAAASGGTGTLSYQWYLESIAVSGATSASYSYTAAGTSHSVTCKVTDNASTPVTSSTSNAVTITVNPALTVTISPGSATLDVGQSKTFTASASGGSSSLSYQWYLDLLEVGTNSTSYSYTATSGLHTIYVNVTDNASTPNWAASNIVSVTVNSAPSVTISPSPVAMDVGQTQTFTAAPGGGSRTYTGYQWYVNGSEQNGQTASTFSFTPTSVVIYSITVTVTDSLSATSAQSTAALVTVNAAPTVTITPTGPLTLTVGQIQPFTAATSGGSGSLSYQWYLDSVAVGSNSTSYSYTAAIGTHSVTCTVTDNASTPFTSPTSNAVSLTVNPASTPTPTPSLTPSPTLSPTSTTTPIPAATPTPTKTASPSPTIPEFPAQLIGITLFFSIILILSVAIIVKKRIA
jgi:YVTN family beta-propeller protein